jgi:glucose/arabinose dehydrogenase
MRTIISPLVLSLLLSVLVGGAGGAEPIAVEHFEPEPIRISVEDLPKPFHSQSANKKPEVVSPPEKPVLNVPEGFRVNLFAEVESARWLALTPEEDVLCAASRNNQVLLLRDTDGDGAADEREVFLDEARGANLPFGMAFADGAFYLGNTDGVLRYEYRRRGDAGSAGQLGDSREITRLPGQGYNQHWTRNVVLAPDGETLYVSVGSETNVDPEESPRASILRMKLDGSQREVFATGLRNPVGLDFHPATGELYATVNERDGLGDDLVPDYLAHVQQGEFYGWPYAYLRPQLLDPRRTQNGQSERGELAAKTHTPDVLFQSHSAALGLAFPRGEQFPERYRQGAYVAFRGSWNRDRGTGYKIVFVPFDDAGEPVGHYEDFVTGFLLDPAGPRTWGRPVGVLALPDGSLLFTEEANGRIYRVSYGDSDGA